MAGSNSSKKAKRAAGKSKATKTGRNPKTSGISRALDKLFGLVCLFTVLARVDFLTAFGVGTGVNKAHLSPVGILSHYVTATTPLKSVDPRLDLASRKMVIALAVPREVLSDLTLMIIPGSDQTSSDSSKSRSKSKSKSKSKDKGEAQAKTKAGEDYYNRALRWTQKNAKNGGLARATHSNHMLVAGAVVVLFGGIVAFLFPELGFTSFIGGALMLYVGANMTAPKVSISYGITHVVLPVAVYALFIQQRLAQVGAEKSKQE